MLPVFFRLGCMIYLLFRAFSLFLHKEKSLQCVSSRFPLVANFDFVTTLTEFIKEIKACSTKELSKIFL